MIDRVAMTQHTSKLSNVCCACRPSSPRRNIKRVHIITKYELTISPARFRIWFPFRFLRWSSYRHQFPDGSMCNGHFNWRIFSKLFIFRGTRCAAQRARSGGQSTEFLRKPRRSWKVRLLISFFSFLFRVQYALGNWIRRIFVSFFVEISLRCTRSQRWMNTWFLKRVTTCVAVTFRHSYVMLLTFCVWHFDLTREWHFVVICKTKFSFCCDNLTQQPQ